ncbi:MAG: AMP-binding protein [Chromatiales bacterium]|jgi:long-chain acyl-CoA synthetase|nr:AMP-binding protein [Chromatiales bacterium]
MSDTFPKLLLRNAKESGSDDALREKDYGIWRTFAWRDYADEVRRLALGLASMGFVRGDKLGVIGDNRPRMYFAMLAAESLGGISVAVYQDSIASELGFVLEHAEVRFIIAENEEQTDKLYGIKEKLAKVEKVIFDDTRGLESGRDDWLISYEAAQSLGDAYAASHSGYFEAEVAKGQGSDVAMFCYTSGTTGQPKGVMLTYDNFLTGIYATAKAEGLIAGDEVMAYLPMAWVGDFWLSVGSALALKMTTNCPEKRETLNRDFREIGPSVMIAPPAIWEQLLTRVRVRMEEADSFKRGRYLKAMAAATEVEQLTQAGKPIPTGLALRNWLGDWLVRKPLRDLLGMAKVRLAYTGGAPLGPDSFDYIRAMGINLKQLYGMTESSSACVYQADGEANTETVGRALDVTEIKISEGGEILLRGPMVFSGYYKNEEATKETVDADGWMATGDAGIITDDGQLKVIDRAKDVSKLINGTVFAPQFIENKLKFSPYIKEAVCFGREREFVSAMVNIDLDALEVWAERENVTYSGYQELSQKAEVYDLVNNEMVRINANIAQDSALAGAQVTRFLILNKELDADDGEITRTRKIRRTVIADRYGALIAALYEGGLTQVETDIVVTYEDGTTGAIHADLRIMDVTSSASVRAAA